MCTRDHPLAVGQAPVFSPCLHRLVGHLGQGAGPAVCLARLCLVSVDLLRPEAGAPCPLGALLCAGDRVASTHVSVCPPVPPPSPRLSVLPSPLPLPLGSGPHWCPTQTQNEWAVAEQRWREGLTRCREEAEAHLREVQEQVDQLPQQVGAGWAVSPPAVPAQSCPPTPRFR